MSVWLEKRGVGSALAAKAEEHEARKRKIQSKRKKHGSDSDNDEDRDFRLAPSRGEGIQTLAKEEPGALFARGMQEIRKWCAQREGASGDQDAAIVMKYINSIWHGAHPVSEMGVRSTREMKTIGSALDALLSGELAEVGDVLMQRLKALVQSHKDGHWQVAQHLELVDAKGIGATSAEELNEACRAQLAAHKIREAIAKAKGEGTAHV